MIIICQRLSFHQVWIVSCHVVSLALYGTCSVAVTKTGLCLWLHRLLKTTIIPGNQQRQKDEHASMLTLRDASRFICLSDSRRFKPVRVTWRRTKVINTPRNQRRCPGRRHTHHIHNTVGLEKHTHTVAWVDQKQFILLFSLQPKRERERREGERVGYEYLQSKDNVVH